MWITREGRERHGTQRWPHAAAAAAVLSTEHVSNLLYQIKGMNTAGYTVLGPGVKQGQGTRKEGTTPSSSPTGLSQPGNKREGTIVGCVKMHE